MTTDLAALTARLQRLEDERDISRLIASYGPHVDSANADGAAALWADEEAMTSRAGECPPAPTCMPW